MTLPRLCLPTGGDGSGRHHLVLCSTNAQRVEMSRISSTLRPAVEQVVGAHQLGEAPGPADRHVQPVLGEQEVGATGYVGCTRRRHREEHDRRLPPWKDSQQAAV